MRIIHFSDWHGAFRPIPKADMYICTGDMLYNYPNVNRYGEEVISREKEIKNQSNRARKMRHKGGIRKFLGTHDAPVIVVRGNHDFVDLGEIFGGEVYEIGIDPTVTFNVMGLTVGGFRGIPYICGEWSDELRVEELDNKARLLPAVDILCTHGPPLGTLDAGLGSKALTSYHNRMYYLSNEVKLHCFGHIHEARGIYKEVTIYSNAATTYNEVEI